MRQSRTATPFPDGKESFFRAEGALQRTEEGGAGAGAEEYCALAGEYSLIPLALRLPLGEMSPENVYERLRTLDSSVFLLEGDGRDLHGGRYALLGAAPLRIFRAVPEGVAETDAEGRESLLPGADLLETLRSFLAGVRLYDDGTLPPFCGGVVGFFGYEMAELWEDLFHDQPGKRLPSPDHPASVLFVPGIVAVTDAVEHSLTLLVLTEPPEPRGENAAEDVARFRRSYENARHRLAALEKLFAAPEPAPSAHGAPCGKTGPVRLVPSVSRKRFGEMVQAAREHIARGDAYQIVLSHRFECPAPADPLTLYGSLKAANPSPYLFCMEFPELALVGSSPEVLLRVQGHKVISRPLAGTRRRGATPREDRVLETELRKDEKERAEHVMLVDLARNDLARICRPESVVVSEYLEVERFARVMHLVSQVEGVLRDDRDALDALRASFPAGTVSGAPKIRAMEILADLEGLFRGVYAGGVGYVDFRGNLDICIAIRTFVIRENILRLQAGAGIVADSDPDGEYEETLNKARALFRALGDVEIVAAPLETAAQGGDRS